MHHGSPWFRLTLCILATWRASHLVAHEDGPFDVIIRLRARTGDGMLGRLMDCPYCVSLWLAAPAAWLLGGPLPEWCVAWLAISGGAALVEKLWRAAGELPEAATDSRLEGLEGGEGDGMLRTEARSDDQAGDVHDGVHEEVHDSR